MVTGFIFWPKRSNHVPSVHKEESIITFEVVKKDANSEPVKIKHSNDIEEPKVSEQIPPASSYKTSQDILSKKAAAFFQDDDSLEKEKGRQIIAKLRHNFDGLNKVSYQVQWESLNNDDGESNFLAEVKFKRPFYYSEKGVKGRIYSYFSEGMFEQYTYDAHSYGFVGESEAPELDKVNEGDGFLARFPLRILQTKDMKLLGQEDVVDSNGDSITCEVVGNDYWKVYVAENSNVVIRADYYRHRDKTDDVILSLTDFKYSKVEVGKTETGEKKVMDFPVSFKVICPATDWAYKCSVLNLQVNDQNSFDDSIFKYRPELYLKPEF